MTLDLAYRSRRQRIAQAVTARAAAIFAASHADQPQALAQLIPTVEAGQRHTADLVVAYMAAKAVEQTGRRPNFVLDTRSYTIELLRGVPAAAVYSRPFGALYATLNKGVKHPEALTVAQHSLVKLAATDLQLAQTHAARDWLTAASETVTAGLRIVGYRRVLTGPGPHCPLCTLASTRTYHVADLMAIHEHCTCTVEPLWGTEPVASVGTTVRTEIDPELGPRLMADTWSQVGPRLHVQ